MLLFDQDRINDNSVCVDELSEEYAITEDAENDEIVGKV